MLLGISNDNTSSNSVTGLASRLRSLTPQNKVLIGSTILLAILFVISIASATTPNRSNNTDANIDATVTSNNAVDLTQGTTNLLDEVTKNESSVQTNVNVDASANLNGQAVSPNVELNVNGQDIPVPENGEVQEVIGTSSNNSNVNVNVNSSTSTSDDGDDRTRIRINSESESEVRVRYRN